MRTVKVQDAIGMALAHDMTQILPGKYKGSRFKKGHILKSDDVEVLLSMGKENIFVLELGDGILHEDEAALRLANAAAGSNLEQTAVNEGKIEFKAACDGLLKINVQILNRLNDQEAIMFATIHSNQLVRKGETLGGTRVIPLTIPEAEIVKAEEICADGTLIEVKPLKSFKVGLVTTGSEIYKGIIKDAFGPVLEKKFAKLGSNVYRQILASDDEDKIVSAVHEMIDDGADLIALTGGMSVDPDDRTPASIRKAGAEIVTYGVPVLPGAMFMLGYIGDVPVIGLPGCVMYHATSIFDLIVPRLLAGEKPTRAEIKALGHGGFCRHCEVCYFPNCGFGKGF
jgi:molybdenum cofactor synthesis domain-containing protein